MSLTSFLNLARRDQVTRVEVPIIQRDYAQGRSDENTLRIRSAFLDVLHRAATTDRRVHLDFVYGEVLHGALIPLDGQQRLTALFLLHWYLAARTGRLLEREGAPLLSYRTRYSSRLFCRKLLNQTPFPLPPGLALSQWIRDQPGFVRAWRHDQTIDSMLVVLDDLHTRFEHEDCEAAWTRVADKDAPAITFHFLNIGEFGLTDDLYIKMNSRGKPLTSFENFKAEFEELVKRASPPHYDELCVKVDNQWLDVFWKQAGEGDSVDEQFLRYFRYLTDVSAALGARFLSGGDIERTAEVFGGGDASALANLNFLFRSLDVWTTSVPRDWFATAFTRSGHEAGKVAIFDRSVDLFATCARMYRTPLFPLWKQLLLFAALEHLRDETAEFARRLRTLRNLVFHPQSFLREEELPTLLADTRKLIQDDALPERGPFGSSALAEERRKRKFVANTPGACDLLYRLEDHELLRGSLASFDLDEQFEVRGAAFLEVFAGSSGLPTPAARRALLACGDCSYPTKNGKIQFPTDTSDSWRTFLTRSASRIKLPLQLLLDRVASRQGSVDERCRQIAVEYLDECEAQERMDWRYYLVKYDEMRQGKSGLYASVHYAMSFDLCMLDKQQMNSWYRDPYLLAICSTAGVVLGTDVSGKWFTSYAYLPRWLGLTNGAAAIRCVDAGFQLRGPREGSPSNGFMEVRTKYGVGDDDLVRVPQVKVNGVTFDTADRVQLGGRLLSDLVAM